MEMPLSGSDLPEDVIIPRNGVLLRIERKYGPLKDEVRCGLEGCREPHRKGFVVRFKKRADAEDAYLGIIGHVCGSKAFGESWQAVELRYRAEERRAQIDGMTRHFKTEAEEILPQMRAALPKLQRHRNIRNALLEHAPELMQVCAHAFRSSNGELARRTATGDFIRVMKLKGRRFWIQDEALRRAEEWIGLTERALEFLGGTPTLTQVSESAVK